MTKRQDLQTVARLFVAERRIALLGGTALAACTVLAGVGLLGLSGWFITASALAGMTAAGALAFDVFVPSAGIRFLALARTASRYGERLITHDATLSILAGLRERLFRGWARPDAARALRARPARLLFRLTADIDALDALYLRVLVPAGAAMAAAVVAGIVVGVMQPLLGGLLLIALIGVGLGVPIVAARCAQRPALRRAHATEALRARTIDLVAGQTELAMAGRLGAQREALARIDAQLARADHALDRIESGVAASFGIASAMALAATLLVLGTLAQAGRIDAPWMVLGVLITGAAVEPFGALRRGALDLGRFLLAARRLAPRLQPAIEPRRVPDPEPGVAIGLDDVTLRHPGARFALFTDLSFEIRTGERVALVGSSGAGKSSLLGLIAGEIDAGTGHIATIPATWLTQRTELFHDTLRENLRLANATADDRQLWAALEASGLADVVRALPRGLDTVLGEHGLGLSGGQARRLTLARLSLRDAPLWLLDEPTEGLDAATARDVLHRLQEQAFGRTVVVATHLRREAALADRIMVIERGRIIAALHRGEAGFESALAALRPD